MQGDWLDNQAVEHLFAKLKGGIVQTVAFLLALYFLVPRIFKTGQTVNSRFRAFLQTMRKLDDVVELLLALCENLTPAKLASLLRLEAEIGQTGFQGKLEEFEALLLLEVATRRASMSASGRAFYEADTRGHWTFASIGMARLLGCSVQDCLGLGWLAFVQDTDRARVVSSWFEAVQQERQFSCFFVFQRNSSDVVSVSASAIPVADGANKVLKYVGVINLIQSGATAKPLANLLPVDEGDSGPQPRLK